ncbi:MAG: hypothetical protein L7H07_02810 [Candidatus Nanopusillus sp.]|nr:hypothetical protein [Candidatus Nanopusillus sp.]
MTLWLLILEGLDGTGKTTVASSLIRYSTYTLPIHYVYFSKKDSEQMTYDYFQDFISVFRYLNGIVIMDRSIISTYAYGVSTINNLGLLDLLRDYDPIIVYFDKVYDSSKLPSDYERIKERYLRALRELRPWLHIPYVVTNAETFLNRVNSLEKLVKLFKLKDLP